MAPTAQGLRKRRSSSHFGGKKLSFGVAEAPERRPGLGASGNGNLARGGRGPRGAGPGPEKTLSEGGQKRGVRIPRCNPTTRERFVTTLKAGLEAPGRRQWGRREDAEGGGLPPWTSAETKAWGPRCSSSPYLEQSCSLLCEGLGSEPLGFAIHAALLL